MWRRVIVLVAIFASAVLIWRNWDTLAPDKLLARIQDWLGDASGSYPVDISGTEGKALLKCQGYTVLLNDSYLTYYNDRGGEVNRYTCTYTSPLVRAEGKYVLVAEQGGRRLMLTTRSSTLLDMTMNSDILSVSLNAKGQIAVLTQGTQGYAVDLFVYTHKGEQVYSRQRNALASDVALSPDGKAVALVSVDAVNGMLSTTMEAFLLKSTDTAALCAHTVSDTLVRRIEFLDKDRMVAIGESGAWLFSLDGSAPTVYAIGTDRLLGYTLSDTDVALVTRPAGTTDGGVVTVVSADGVMQCQVPFSGEFRHMTSYKSQYLLLTDRQVQTLDSSGAGASVAIGADGQQAVLTDNSAIVLGLSMIQKYPLT